MDLFNFLHEITIIRVKLQNFMQILKLLRKKDRI